MNFELSGTAALIVIVVIISLPAVIILTVAALASRARSHHRIQAGQVITAEYDPPDNLSPAEVGYLLTLKGGRRLVYGTVFDLERRGFLKTSQGPEGMICQVTGQGGELKPHEQVVMVTLQQNPAALGAQADPFLYVNFWMALDKQVRGNDYIKGSRVGHFLRAMVAASLLMELVFPWSFMLLGIKGAWEIFDFLLIGVVVFFTVYMPVALVVTLIYSKVAGHGWMGTAKFRQLWPQLEGYKDYIRLGELDQLKYETADLQAACREEAFPYAVALGFSTGWSGSA